MKNIPICASCIGMNFQKPVLSSDKKLPKWLENFNYVHDFIDHTKTIKSRKKENTFPVSLQLSDKYIGKYILYWASKPSKNELKTLDAKSAYGKFENSGISRVNKNGKVTFYIQCPQNYKTIIEGKKEEDTFYRHVHFLFQKKEKEWDKKKIYTKVITCSVPITDIKKGILLHTLSKEDYEKEHIPNSYHLDAKMVKKMSREDLHHFFYNLIEKYYPKIKTAVDKKKIEWYAVPLILYCKNKKCNASELCLEELYKKGMVNIKLFKGGIDEYKYDRKEK